MSISGVTTTAPGMAIPIAQAPLQVPGLDEGNIAEMAAGSSDVPFAMAVSSSVMDMTLDVFEDAAGQLISALMAMQTGIGRNVDVTV